MSERKLPKMDRVRRDNCKRMSLNEYANAVNGAVDENDEAMFNKGYECAWRDLVGIILAWDNGN